MPGSRAAKYGLLLHRQRLPIDSLIKTLANWFLATFGLVGVA